MPNASVTERGTVKSSAKSEVGAPLFAGQPASPVSDSTRGSEGGSAGAGASMMSMATSSGAGFSGESSTKCAATPLTPPD